MITAPTFSADVRRAVVLCFSQKRSGMITRGALFSTLSAIGFVNGISDHVTQGLEGGLAIAVFDTFGVSWVAWSALVIAVFVMRRAPDEKATQADGLVSICAASAYLVPVAAASWLGVFLIACWLLRSSRANSDIRRGAIVLAALTVPMLWARLLLAVLSQTVLSIDAKIVSWVVGTQSSGNTIPFADGSGILLLEPACSSLSNLSLTILCGVLFVNVLRLKLSAQVFAAIGLACMITVLVNVLRISSIGIFPVYYDQIHGHVGAATAQWICTLFVLVIYVELLRPRA